MSEPDSDQVRPDNREILPASPAPNEVCIISSDPLRAFIAALSPALRAREEFTIIVDRRRADRENAVGRRAIERRHRPSVDAKVKTDGFAIVSLSTTDAPLWIEHVVDHQSADDHAEVDECKLPRMAEFKCRRKARVGPLVRISAIVGAVSVLVVLFVQVPAGKSLVNRARLVALPISERTLEPPIEAQAASLAKAPVPPWIARPPVNALDPTRLSDGGLPRRARSVSTPGEAPAHLSSAPRQPSARGLEAGIEALAGRVTSDVNTASVEARRQFDELQSKTMKSLAEMRRIWNNARIFGQ